MASAPERFAHPLEAAGRPSLLVTGDGVIGGIVKKVRPVVDIRWPGLDGFFPVAALLDIGDAAGTQDSHYLIGIDLAGIFGYDKIDEIVDIRQQGACKRVNRNLAADTAGANIFPSLADHFSVHIEAMDEKTIIFQQFRGQGAIAASEMNDQAALDVGRVEDPLGFISILVGKNRLRASRHCQNQQCR